MPKITKHGYLFLLITIFLITSGSMCLPTEPDKIHTIIATAGTGGSISPSGTIKVSDGADQTFKITPDSGYEVAELKVYGVPHQIAVEITLLRITTDGTIDVTFKKQPTNDTTTVDTTTVVLPPNYDQSNQLLISYAKIKHDQMITAFENDEAKRDRDNIHYWSDGIGDHIDGYGNNLTSIQIFTDDLIQYIRQLKQTMPIDKTAINNLLKDYQATDVLFIKTFAYSHFKDMSSIGKIEPRINIVIPNINNIYSLAILQIPVI